MSRPASLGSAISCGVRRALSDQWLASSGSGHLRQQPQRVFAQAHRRARNGIPCSPNDPANPESRPARREHPAQPTSRQRFRATPTPARPGLEEQDRQLPQFLMAHELQKLAEPHRDWRGRWHIRLIRWMITGTKSAANPRERMVEGTSCGRGERRLERVRPGIHQRCHLVGPHLAIIGLELTAARLHASRKSAIGADTHPNRRGFRHQAERSFRS